MLRFRSENLFEKVKTAKSVTKLSIRYPDYNLEDYGSCFLRFKKLKSLFLQSKVNNMNLIPDDLGELKTLRKLEILNFNYQEFPNWILNLSSLERLLFRGHNVEQLPESIMQLVNLKSFRLENCAIQKLPESMFKMNKLVHLSLADNFMIQSIDHDCLPVNLKELKVTPSNLSAKQKEMIRENRPDLKLISHE